MDDTKVAVLLEDLREPFRSFGEGLQIVNDKIDKVDQTQTGKIKPVLFFRH